MAQPIPDEWKRKVREAIDSGDPGRILVRLSAQKRWDDAFPLSFPFQMLAALAEALSDRKILGARKIMDESTETYAFFFYYERTKMYGKVGLQPDGTVIIVYSAHTPDSLKGDRL